MGSCLTGTEFMFYKMKRALEMDGGDVVNILKHFLKVNSMVCELHVNGTIILKKGPRL